MEPLNKAELLAVVDEIRTRIEADDSWEGYLNYVICEEDDPPDTYARVEARFRVGNSMGQGGMKMIGVDIDEAPA